MSTEIIVVDKGTLREFTRIHPNPIYEIPAALPNYNTYYNDIWAKVNLFFVFAKCLFLLRFLYGS